MGCHSLNHARQKVMNKMKFKVIVKGKCAVCGKEIQDDGFFLCKVCRLLNKDHEQAEGGAVESSPMIGGENMETVADIIEEVR